MKPSSPYRKTCRLSCLGLALLPCFHALPLRADTLRSQLESLAKQNGILLEGLDRLGAAPARQAEGDAAQRIKALLSDYNFMIVGQGGRIERLAITSPKQFAPRPQSGGAVKTQRLGMHHQVGMVVLNGPNNVEIRTSLLVDTGATTVVLPASMIGPLGFRPEDLQAGASQTAGGAVQVKTGLLKSVKVGDVVAENVPVSFIADQRLGGARLLGMSFLNRFRFSLDDASNELLLLPK
jgi:aspartyl protease family protein